MSEVINPFDDNAATTPMMLRNGEIGSTEQNEGKSNAGLYVVAGVATLLVGGAIALGFYQAYKGVRPVYVTPGGTNVWL